MSRPVFSDGDSFLKCARCGESKPCFTWGPVGGMPEVRVQLCFECLSRVALEWNQKRLEYGKLEES
jgi:hypothetical protein